MKHNLTTIAALGVLLSGCLNGNWSGARTVRGSGKVIAENRNIGQFDVVTVSGSGRLSIVQDQQESLTITADDNLLPLIKSETSGGSLRLGLENVNLSPTQTIHYSLHLKTLKELRLSGALRAEAPSLKTEQLKLAISGSGTVRMPRLEAAQLDVRVSGSGDLAMGGRVTRQNIQLSGSGNYHAADCDSEDAVVHISGSGNASVWAHRTLEAHISGSGSIKYYGSPQATSHVSGSGSIRSLGNR